MVTSKVLNLLGQGTSRGTECVAIALHPDTSDRRYLKMERRNNGMMVLPQHLGCYRVLVSCGMSCQDLSLVTRELHVERGGRNNREGDATQLQKQIREFSGNASATINWSCWTKVNPQAEGMKDLESNRRNCGLSFRENKIGLKLLSKSLWFLWVQMNQHATAFSVNHPNLQSNQTLHC